MAGCSSPKALVETKVETELPPEALLKRVQLPKEKPPVVTRDIVESRDRWKATAIKQDGIMVGVQNWRRGAAARIAAQKSQ